jgi:hypothetical protein
MAYHDDLLRQALQLVHKEPRNPKQASLRRAVLTAYYALFHLLISEAVANWRRKNLRASLGRAFDHGTMKAASNRIQDTGQFPFVGEDRQVVAALRAVAKTLVQLREKRHTALIMTTQPSGLERKLSPKSNRPNRHSTHGTSFATSRLLRHI